LVGQVRGEGHHLAQAGEGIGRVLGRAGVEIDDGDVRAGLEELAGDGAADAATAARDQGRAAVEGPGRGGRSRPHGQYGQAALRPSTWVKRSMAHWRSSRVTNSSGAWAWAMSPGPMTTASMPAALHSAASVQKSSGPKSSGRPPRRVSNRCWSRHANGS